MPTKTITAFCANEQEETAHALDFAPNGEIQLTCDCGRFIKLPADTDAAGIQAYLKAHKESNVGQVSQKSIDEAREKLLDSLA